jgi:hypothetical protein
MFNKMHEEKAIAELPEALTAVGNFSSINR